LLHARLITNKYYSTLTLHSQARISREELEALSKEDLVEKCCEQENSIKNLESKVSLSDESEQSLMVFSKF
jgi:hypothetical protein